MSPSQNLETLQRILHELRDYSAAHVGEDWARIVHTKVDEALSTFSEEEDYLSLSGKTLQQIYQDVKEEDTTHDLLHRLNAPNSILDALMKDDD